MNIGLFLSLILPWFSFEYFDKKLDTYSAFSSYAGYLGYGIIFAIGYIPFFLLSHTKKEKMRNQVPFRLSDTQAIVFLSSIFLALILHMLFIFRVYAQQIAQGGVTIHSGFYFAFISFSFIMIASYFLSKTSKKENSEICYLDNQNDDELQEYHDILEGDKYQNKDKNNMTLPI